MVVDYDDKTKRIVISKASKLEYNQAKIWLERYAQDYRFKTAFKLGHWDGKINHFHQGNIRVGLWREVAKSLQQIGSKLEISNREDFPVNRDVDYDDFLIFCKDFFKDHMIKDKETGKIVKFFPYDHQIDAAFAILKNRYCTAEVATSGGKSLILSMVYFYILKHIDPDAKLLLIVPSIQLVTQFYDEILNYNNGFFKDNKNPMDLKIQEIMSDKPRQWHGEGEPNIYISTYQSLAKPENFGEKFYKQFYMTACDEAHLAKAKSFKTILTRTIKGSYYQVGVSGTFQDDGTAEYLTIQSLTGPKVKKVAAKELQDKGIIAPVRISQIYLNHDDPKFNNRLVNIRSNPNQGAVAYRLEGDYIRASDKRKEFISRLSQKFDNNTLILFNIIEYGESLLNYLKERYRDVGIDDVEFMFISGKIKKKVRQEILRKMELNDGVTRILLATYGTLSVGVSVNNIHNIIFAEGFKAEQRIIQAIGRSLRLHAEKVTASIYDLVDVFIETRNTNALYRHGGKRREMYRRHQYPYSVKKFML